MSTAKRYGLNHYKLMKAGFTLLLKVEATFPQKLIMTGKISKSMKLRMHIFGII